MNDIPDFAEAFRQFRGFLKENGHSDDVFWIFREDFWRLSVTEALVKYPPNPENESLAQKVFEEGRERGLVEISAVAVAGGRVAATVWFSKYPHEEVQGWNRNMKLVISQPLPEARQVPKWRWTLFRFLPRYRQAQRFAGLIGTREWAAS